MTDEDCASGTVCGPSDSGAVVGATTVTFTPDTWNVPVSVTVAALDDSLQEEGTHSAYVRMTAASADLRYDSTGVCAVVNAGTSTCTRRVAALGARLTLIISDNDAAGFALTPSAIAGTEGGDPSGYVLSLATRPWGPVTMTVSPDAQVGVDATTMVILLVRAAAQSLGSPEKYTRTLTVEFIFPSCREVSQL